MVPATCPDRDVLGRLLVGELAEQDSAVVVRHLEECESCLAALREASASDPLLSAVRHAAPSRETVSHAGVGETLSGEPASGVPRIDPLVEELIDRLTRARLAASQAASASVPQPQSQAPAQEQAEAFAFLRPAEAADELGRLGPYRVLKVLGQGGMGVVFQAQDPRLNRLCALKVMRPEMAQRPGMKERFLREARAAAALESDYVVPIYQVDEDNGAPFIAMPFLKGMSLEDWLQTREREKPGSRLKPAVILKLARDMARGLAEAHSQGMIHRDIKPANVWLDSKVNGRARILDFGLARLSDAAGEQHLTQSGAILGTPSYMAPEQAQSDQIDARADLFSLGVVLYRLCTGELPFRGHNTMATLLALAAHHPPAPIQVHPATPAAVSDLVMRLLAKEPDKRIGSAKEVLSEIQRIERELAAETRPGTQATADGAPTTAAAGGNVEASAARSTALVTEPSLTIGEATNIAPAATKAAAVWASATNQASLAIERLKARVPPGRKRIALALLGGAAALLAGILLYWETGRGTVRIEINAPGISAQVDGDGAIITQADKPEVRLSPGDHGLKIKYGDVEFETDTFVLARGGEVDLKVELLPGKVQVLHGDKAIGEAALPLPGATVAIKGWHGWPLDAPPPAIAPFDATQARVHQEAWAKYLNVPVAYTNSIGMKFRLIPPGEFMMGSTAEEIEEALLFVGRGESWREQVRSEAPRHRVVLTQPIYLGMHEVTQAQYASIIGRNPSHFAATGPGKDAVLNLDTSAHPVESVSWNDAAEYCAKLSGQEQLKPYYLRNGEAVSILNGGSGYRLPTEAEWEFACRGGTTAKYCTGNQDESLSQAAWFLSNSDKRTHAVGELKPNTLGLFDLHGNVYEWVGDWWDANYYAQFDDNPAINPVGPISARPGRVLRGGRWGNYAPCCRASGRRADGQQRGNNGIGFRIALPIDSIRTKLVVRTDSATTTPYRESDEYRQLMPGTWYDVPAESFSPEVAAAWTLEDGAWTFNGSPAWSPCKSNAVIGMDYAFRARIEALDSNGNEGTLVLRTGPDEQYQGINFSARTFWGFRRLNGVNLQLGILSAPEWPGWSAPPQAPIELTAYVQGGRLLMFADGERVSEMHDPHPVAHGSVGMQPRTSVRVRDMQVQYLNDTPLVIPPPPVVIGDAQVALTGPPRPFVVKDIEGAIDVTPTSGTTPARLTIKCREGAGTAYKVALSLPDDELNLPVAGWITGGKWTVAYRVLPNHQGEAPPAESPAAAPDDQESTGNLTWTWGDKPPSEKTPDGPFLLTADLKAALPAGWYRLRATAGRSVRARLDGQTVLDNWLDPSIGRSAAYVQVDEGPHAWQVESFQPATDRSLSVVLEPLPADFTPPASTDPAALADRLAAEWAQRVGGWIKITADGREVALTAKEILPDGEFTLNEITPTPNGFQPADLALHDTRLTSLHLRQLPAGEAAMARVGRMERLKFLALFETGTSNDALRHVAGLKNLEGLWVQRVAVDDAGLVHLAGLTKAKRLSLLDLNLTDEGLESLAKMPALEELHLGGCGKVTGTFATEFRKSPLKSISLNSPFVQATTEGLTAIAALPHLERLELGDRSRVASESLAALRDQPTLKHLGLGGVEIGDEAVPHLASIPQLIELDIRGTLITEQGLTTLKAALPNCQIAWQAREPAAKP